MIICDRCKEPAVDMVVFTHDDQRFDLCAVCRQVALEVLTGKVVATPNENVGKPGQEKKVSTLNQRQRRKR